MLFRGVRVRPSLQVAVLLAAFLQHSRCEKYIDKYGYLKWNSRSNILQGAETRLEFRFRYCNNKGVLIYQQGEGRNFFALGVNDERLYIEASIDGLAVEMYVGESVRQNQNHDVTIIGLRTLSSQTRFNINGIAYTPEGLTDVVVNLDFTRSILIGETLIGGYATIDHLRLRTQRLKAYPITCITFLRAGQTDIDLNNPSSQLGVSDECVVCLPPSTVTLTKVTSYLKMRVDNTPRFNTVISLKFRTKAPDGLLFYFGGPAYMALYLEGGALVLRLNTRGTVEDANYKTTRMTFNDGEMQEVLVTRYGDEANLRDGVGNVHAIFDTTGYFQSITFPAPRNVSNYAMLGTTLSQDLRSFTLCLQMRTDMSSTSHAGVVSYAVQQEHNELLIFNQVGRGLVLWVQGNSATLGDLPVWDGKRHEVCVTWRSTDGAWQVYTDDVIQASGSGLNVGGAVRSGGTWILAQDQDTVGGGFDTSQAFTGELTQVNLWDRVLTPAEIGTNWPFCGQHGNVIEWTSTNINVFGLAIAHHHGCSEPLNAEFLYVGGFPDANCADISENIQVRQSFRGCLEDLRFASYSAVEEAPTKLNFKTENDGSRDVDFSACLESASCPPYSCTREAQRCSLGVCECIHGYGVRSQDPLLCYNIDDCTPNPCQNGAVCTDKIADYNCTCTDRYKGKNCSSIRNCYDFPCLNGVQCIELNTTTPSAAGRICSCAPGYKGEDCGEDCDECSEQCNSGMCVNYISCENRFGDFICECEPGYEWKNCSKEIDRPVTPIQLSPANLAAIFVGLIILLVLVIVAVAFRRQIVYRFQKCCSWMSQQGTQVQGNTRNTITQGTVRESIGLRTLVEVTYMGLQQPNPHADTSTQTGRSAPSEDHAYQSLSRETMEGASGYTSMRPTKNKAISSPCQGEDDYEHPNQDNSSQEGGQTYVNESIAEPYPNQQDEYGYEIVL